MLRILISLSALIAAASLVTIANATMTTVMPLRLLQDGADETTVAIFGAAYFLGFAVGCFSEPPRILRIGYIRAFAAAAALCTSLAIVMDMTDSITLWVVLRFFMGLAIAAIFASVDGWINATTPDAMRGKVFSAYGWCIGASAVLGQLLLVARDGLAVGFITLLALAFNFAVMLVALTRASAPSAGPPVAEGRAAREGPLLVMTSATAILAAIYAGLVTTAVLAILPAILAGNGVSEGVIAWVIASFFIGRLVAQIPVGIIADRVDLRLMIAIVAILTGSLALLGSLLVFADVARIAEEPGLANKLVFLGLMAFGGGLILPLYTVANSLAFARAEGRPAVRIATTLLLVNSAGSVVGPLLVAATLPTVGEHALTLVIAAASAVMAAFALWRRSGRAAHAPAHTGLSEIPTTSVALTGSVAEVKAEAQEMAAAASDESALGRPGR
jgi:MFS family permease